MNRPQSEQHAAIRQAWQDAGLLPAGDRATREQVEAYRQAQYDLERNGRYEKPLMRDGLIREETDLFLDLNDRVWARSAPLGGIRQYWHAIRAADAEDRDFMRLQRESDRQDRERRRPARRRSR